MTHAPPRARDSTWPPARPNSVSPTWQIRLLVYVIALMWCAGEKRFGKNTALTTP